MKLVLDKEYTKYIMLSTFISLATLGLCKSYTGMMVFSMFVLLFLVYQYFTHGSLEYLLYLFLVSTSAITRQDCYSIYSIRIGPIAFIILLTIPIFLNAFYRFLKIPLKYKDGSSFYFLVMMTICVTVGLFSIVINRENYAQYLEIYKSFLSEFQIQFYIPLLYLLAFNIHKFANKEKKEITNKFIRVATAGLFGLYLQVIASGLLGFVSLYGVVETILASSASGMLIIGLTLSEYITNNDLIKKLFLFFGSIATLITITKAPSGKDFVFITLVVVIFCFRGILSKKLILKYLTFIGIFAFIIGAGSFISDYEHGILFNNKFYQFQRMISLWEDNWFMLLPKSPQIRVAETLNILNEYIHYPYLLFTGKGLLGTFQDHLHLFDYNLTGAFSIDQSSTGYFFNPHVGLNVMFLTSGLMGLYFVLKIIKILKKEYNPLLLMGLIWLIVFYGFDMVLTIFGSYCLAAGLLLTRQEELDRG